MSDSKTIRRYGLRMPLQRGDLNALARAEKIAALIIRGHRKFRRYGDPNNTVRLIDPFTARVHDVSGLVIAVKGFVNGERDIGLNCNDCPLSDLIPVGATHV